MAWPVIAEQLLRTLMRTTDLIVAGFFSPAAVAAIGLADLYSRLSLNIGLGLGGGAIALSSQDTGSGASDNRNQTISQAIYAGALLGIPFMLIGIFLAEPALSLLGTSPELARMGGQYLMIIFLSSPARHVSLIAARCLQGVGDTRTPMYINVITNGINILATVILAFGFGPFPSLALIGIGLATAFSDLFAALALLSMIISSKSPLRFVRPRNLDITCQLSRVSLPRIGEGFIDMLAEFPLNALLLRFGVEINAAYQVGRRVFQQVGAPVFRGFATAASVLVGQSLGASEPRSAYRNGGAAAGWGSLSVLLMAVALFVGADSLAHLFAHDADSLEPAVAFIRAFAVSAPFAAFFMILSGALRGAGDSHSALLARTVGKVLFLLGVSYVFGLYLGLGIPALYAALILDSLASALIVGRVFYRRGWIAGAAVLLEERGSVSP